MKSVKNHVRPKTVFISAKLYKYSIKYWLIMKYECQNFFLNLEHLKKNLNKQIFTWVTCSVSIYLTNNIDLLVLSAVDKNIASAENRLTLLSPTRYAVIVFSLNTLVLSWRI